jgi:hypothetical protein
MPLRWIFFWLSCYKKIIVMVVWIKNWVTQNPWFPRLTSTYLDGLGGLQWFRDSYKICWDIEWLHKGDTSHRDIPEASQAHLAFSEQKGKLESLSKSLPEEI